MTQATHTPGPWTAINGTVKAGRFNLCPNVTAGGSAKGLADDRKIAHANANLIAAAPDLLAALKDCYDMIVQEFPHGGSLEVARQARAVIAKATGNGG